MPAEDEHADLVSTSGEPESGDALEASEVLRPRETGHRTTVVRKEMSFHSGPLPSPEQLAAYEKIVPGLAVRWVGWLESETVHRQGMETKDLDAYIAISHRGSRIDAWAMWLGWVLCMAGLGIAVWLASLGAYGAAGWAVFASLGGPSGAMLVKAFRARSGADAPKPE